MPPCEPQIDQAIAKNDTEVKSTLQLHNLKKAIPREAFEKSLIRSLFYLFFDYGMWLGSTAVIHALNNSPVWEQMAFWQQAIATLVFWNIAGFFMWGIFVVGHDCGHTTFSNYDFLNDVIGHICHGSILVPYYPWRLSHSRHHMYHNHVDKDYSHPWYTPGRFAAPDEGLARTFHNNWWLIVTFPLYGWSIYLYGLPDGSHFFPFKNQRLWKNTPKAEYLKCLLSSSVVLLFAAAIYYFCGDFKRMVYYYLVPLAVQGWWLFTVTYLQHHNPNTVSYPEGQWSFVHAAFETVDRKFGFGLDALHHHITDGHVAHHLFFTKIPHYNLPIATKAIKEYLQKVNLQHLYQEDDTWDFPYRVHKYIMDFGFRAHLPSGKKMK
eukprot:CAMPEP_0113934398 /NCGR_PEP_ID=MMETSP1339-20121228/1733_1 /TAXON_ID=94617 /ORGANISM="Fibrocapsa japonica" /LENGTH=377 /DNA_ID=CAMNT_0000936189 /DNA_START=264 /DNA_END=1397 /DNA_ORIENTATION=+ /assembly_acc=CAM_ASM_000762